MSRLAEHYQPSRALTEPDSQDKLVVPAFAAEGELQGKQVEIHNYYQGDHSLLVFFSKEGSKVDGGVYQDEEGLVIRGESVPAIVIAGNETDRAASMKVRLEGKSIVVIVANAALTLGEEGKIENLLVESHTRVGLPGVNRNPNIYIENLTVRGDNNRFLKSGIPMREGWRAAPVPAK